MTDFEIRRGPWGKPWITRDYGPLDWPEEAEKPLNGFLYERPSTISGNLDTKENLSPYHQCQAIVGMMRDRALAVQFKALCSEHFDPWTSAKKEVKDLLKQARAAGGEDFKSGMGSGFHRYSVLADKGEEFSYPTAEFEPWLNCYTEAMERFEVLDWEGFSVCDDLEDPGGPGDMRTAGNWDKLVRDRETGETMIADLKTGRQDNEYAMKIHIQLALYVKGCRYDQETGRRWPIHPELSLSKGLLIHVPFQGGGAPSCDIYPVDLVEGWRLAQLSVDITAARKLRCYKKDALARVKVP